MWYRLNKNRDLQLWMLHFHHSDLWLCYQCQHKSTGSSSLCKSCASSWIHCFNPSESPLHTVTPAECFKGQIQLLSLCQCPASIAHTVSLHIGTGQKNIWKGIYVQFCSHKPIFFAYCCLPLFSSYHINLIIDLKRLHSPSSGLGKGLISFPLSQASMEISCRQYTLWV